MIIPLAHYGGGGGRAVLGFMVGLFSLDQGQIEAWRRGIVYL